MLFAESFVSQSSRRIDVGRSLGPLSRLISTAFTQAGSGVTTNDGLASVFVWGNSQTDNNAAKPKIECLPDGGLVRIIPEFRFDSSVADYFFRGLHCQGGVLTRVGFGPAEVTHDFNKLLRMFRGRQMSAVAKNY